MLSNNTPTQPKTMSAREALQNEGIDTTIISPDGVAVLRHSVDLTTCQRVLALNHPELVSVDLSFHTELAKEQGARQTFAELARNTNICTLNLSYVGLNDTCFKYLGLALPSATGLQSLCLKGNTIGDAGLLEFHNALRGAQTNVRDMDFSSNKIGEQGMLALFELLRLPALAKLQRLSVAFNSTATPQSIAVLCGALGFHTQLRFLDVRGLVEGKTTAVFVQGVCNSSSLEDVEMWTVGNTTDPSHATLMQQMSQVLADNKKRRLAAEDEERRKERQQKMFDNLVLQRSLRRHSSEGDLETTNHVMESPAASHAQPMLNGKPRRKSSSKWVPSLKTLRRSKVMPMTAGDAQNYGAFAD